MQKNVFQTSLGLRMMIENAIKKRSFIGQGNIKFNINL